MYPKGFKNILLINKKKHTNLESVRPVHGPQPPQFQVAVPPHNDQVPLAPVVLLFHARHVVLHFGDGGVVLGGGVPLGGVVHVVPVIVLRQVGAETE